MFRAAHLLFDDVQKLRKFALFSTFREVLDGGIRCLELARYRRSYFGFDEHRTNLHGMTRLWLIA